jgi:hypothetical protein
MPKDQVELPTIKGSSPVGAVSSYDTAMMAFADIRASAEFIGSTALNETCAIDSALSERLLFCVRAIDRALGRVNPAVDSLLELANSEIPLSGPSGEGPLSHIDESARACAYVTLSTTPTALVTQLLKALGPLTKLDERGNAIDEPNDDERAYHIMSPLIGGYVVADAAMLLVMLYGRGNSECEEEADAVYRLASILEAFVANARISTVACAKWRAYIAAYSMDDAYCHPSQYAIEAMHGRVRWDIEDIQSGIAHVSHFASPANMKGELPCWFIQHMEGLGAFRTRKF